MTAPGFHHNHIGAPSLAALDDAGLSRCSSCRSICDAAVDDGEQVLCAACASEPTACRNCGERGTRADLDVEDLCTNCEPDRRSAGGY